MNAVNPTNQQTVHNAPQLNYLTLKVGNKNYKLGSWAFVKDAYDMQTFIDRNNQ